MRRQEAARPRHEVTVERIPQEFQGKPAPAHHFRKGLNNSVQAWRYWCVQDCGGVLGCVLAFGRGCFARVSALLGAFFAPTRVLGALLPCQAANWRAAVTTLVSPSSKASRCLFLARPR